MSTPKKIDPVLVWMAGEALLAEEDAEQMAKSVEALTIAEIEAEMRAGGYDPASVPTTEEFLARGLARAAERVKKRP